MNKEVLRHSSITNAVIRTKSFVQTKDPCEEKCWWSRVSSPQRTDHSRRNTHPRYTYWVVFLPELMTTGRKVKLRGKKKPHARILKARKRPPQMPSPLTYLEECAT